MLTQAGAPFKFYDPRRPIYTHPRFLPGSRLSDCTVHDAIVAEGCYLDRCHDRGVGRRHPHAHPERTRRSGGRCCSAPTSTRPTMPRRRGGDRPRLGIGRDVVLDRVIVDKNARIGDGARLVNEAGVRGRRRRRLLHPQRRHHRAEGRGESSRETSCEGTRRYDHGFPTGRRSAHVCGPDRALGGNAAAALVRRVLQCDGTRLTRRRSGSWVFRRQQSTLAVRAHRTRRSLRVGVGDRCAIVV